MTQDRPSAAPPEPPRDPLKTRAVALQEQPGGAAPRITAAGRGHVAEKILEVAFAAGVKVRTDADLVEVLDAIDIDSEIPTEAFAAVAEILTYVYRANAETPPDFAWSAP